MREIAIANSTIYYKSISIFILYFMRFVIISVNEWIDGWMDGWMDTRKDQNVPRQSLYRPATFWSGQFQAMFDMCSDVRQ